MNIAALVARLLLGLVFLVFGLNGFLKFMNGPLPLGLAGQFLSVLVQSHYDLVVSAVPVGHFYWQIATCRWRLYFLAP
jgi:putative oxidoreductase